VPRLYTKTGDDGTTGLLFGGRISKADAVAEATGALDEAVGVLGLARALSEDERGRAGLLEIQRHLFVVGADISANPAERNRLEPDVSSVTEEMVRRLETWIDELVLAHPLPDGFIVPGASPVSACLDVARAIVRRAERAAVRIHDEGRMVAPDVLFVLARARAGAEEAPSREP
jgi:cob(I)alamin adenosyltransferase